MCRSLVTERDSCPSPQLRGEVEVELDGPWSPRTSQGTLNGSSGIGYHLEGQGDSAPPPLHLTNVTLFSVTNSFRLLNYLFSLFSAS